MISIEDAKKQANILKDFLNKHEKSITQSSCLQVIAMMNNFSDWNTLNAALKKVPALTGKKEFDQEFKISLSEFGISKLSGLRNIDANRVLMRLLQKAQENSLTVTIEKKLPFILISQERFDKALQDLVLSGFINKACDQNNQTVITLNPRCFWKGDKKQHAKAVDLFDDFACIIAFAENRNQSKNTYVTRGFPVLTLFDSISLEKHPKLVPIIEYLKTQDAIVDPRIYLNKVKEFLGSSYYISYGGQHIHIQTLDMKKTIAIIDCDK